MAKNLNCHRDSNIVVNRDLYLVKTLDARAADNEVPVDDKIQGYGSNRRRQEISGEPGEKSVSTQLKIGSTGARKFESASICRAATSSLSPPPTASSGTRLLDHCGYPVALKCLLMLINNRVDGMEKLGNVRDADSRDARCQHPNPVGYERAATSLSYFNAEHSQHIGETVESSCDFPQATLHH